MTELVSNIAFGLLGVATLLTLLRIARGPTLADRILGLDALTMLGAATIGVLAYRTGLDLFLDISIVVIFVGFVSTAAFARYILTRGDQ